MNPLPDINPQEVYNSELREEKTYLTNLRSLVDLIEKEENPIEFKDQLMAITQLYFDGLCDKSTETGWEKQKEILHKLYLAGKMAIGSFYRGQGVDHEEIKEMVLPHASEIIKEGSEDTARERCIDKIDLRTYCFGYNLPNNLNKRISKNSEGLTYPPYLKRTIDKIVGIASGGFEPSFLAMSILENDDFTPIRYSIVYRKDKGMKIPQNTNGNYLSSITGKNILVVEDSTVAGTTLRNFVYMISKLNPREIHEEVVVNNSIPMPLGW